MLLRTRVLLPVAGAALGDAGVWVTGRRIRSIGRWREVRETARRQTRSAGDAAPAEVDLGDAVVCPGFVNAHCHLDYTDLAGQLAPPRHFADWIKAILAAKSSWGFSEFAASWLRGARQLLETGTTSVANIESVPEMLADVRAATPLRIFSFLEMTGVRSGRDPAEILAEARRRIDALPSLRGGAGYSPHAPYSTLPDLLRLTAILARKTGRRVTTHVAESRDEFDMYMYRRGRMYDWLRSQRPMDDCGHGSPVGHLERCGLLGPEFLAVHVNHLWHDDARILAERGAHVVHCPRSHRYFRHQCFPYPELRQAGVNVALGTDSLASVIAGRGPLPTLSMPAEMATFAAGNSESSPGEILRLATQSGAAALGMAGAVGQVTPGAFADLAVIPWSGPAREAAEAVVHHRGPVLATLIDGCWEWRRPDFAPVTEEAQ